MEVQLFGSLNSTTDSIILLNFNILDLGECEMKYIDKAHWSRKDHFDYFRTFSYPHFNLCANMDITLFSHFVKQQKLSFFAAFLYVASRAANAIPEFRYRIRGEDIVEHDEVTPSVTVLTRHDTFSYVAIPWQEDFHAFVADARTRTQAAKNGDACIEDEPGRDDLLYVTSIPWVSFTSLTHPIQMNPVDSIPRISWGKYFPQGDRTLLPLSVQGHHALLDGLHVGQYFAWVQEWLNTPEKWAK